MTDEQIIKAADVCRTGKCSGCPYHGLYTAGCVTELIKDVFGFINRQKAEKERLKQELDLSKAFHKEAVAERNLYLHQMAYHKNAYKTAKSEAIKEFAERLKRTSIGLENGSKEKAYFFVDVQDIDNLVKEMTEVQE